MPFLADCLALLAASSGLLILSSARILPRNDLSDMLGYSDELISMLGLYPTCNGTCTDFRDTATTVCNVIETLQNCWCEESEEGSMHECARCLLIESRKAKNETAFNTASHGHESYHDKCTAANRLEYHSIHPAVDTPKSYSDHHTNAGVIAGAVVGGVVGLALIGLLTFFIHRRTKKRKPQAVQRVEYADPGFISYSDEPHNPVPYLETAAATYPPSYPPYSPPASLSPPLSQQDRKSPPRGDLPYTPPPPEGSPGFTSNSNHRLSYQQVLPNSPSTQMASFPAGWNTGRFSGVAEPDSPGR